MIRKLILRWRNNRKISRASKAGVLLTLAFAAPATANPAVHGQELTIRAGGSATVRGYADGSEGTLARLYWNGVYHEWHGCHRSGYSVHLWVCEGFYVPPGRSAYANVGYENVNGWSWGYTPWVWSSGSSTNSATSGVIG